MKNFVLDTCVLVHNPESLFAFEKNNVYIPFVVLEEIDNLKTREGETGRNARHTARHLDELRLKGSLVEGVELENGGKLFVMLSYSGAGMPNIDMDKNDNKILSTACVLKFQDKLIETILVTNDVNLRVKADTLGVRAEFFGKKSNNKDGYTGVRNLVLEEETFEKFKHNGWVGLTEETTKDFKPNEYFILDKGLTGKKALARFHFRKRSLVKLIEPNEGIYGIKAKSDEQRFLFDALLNPEIHLVTVQGLAGSGKTLCSIAAGLEQTINDNLYDKMLVARPTEAMGKDIGFLPGLLEEKLAPWMQPINDNLDFLFDLEKRHSKKKTQKVKTDPGMPKRSMRETLKEQGILEVEALTFIRGRSIPRQFFLTDEAQNLTPHEVKTIITRAGEGTKIVLTGDTKQIDTPYLDQHSNGLAYCVERMKGSEIHAHITLTQCERSRLAEEAAELL